MRRLYNLLYTLAGGPLSRAGQLKLWTWDVFICHAGTDKRFAQMLREAMPVGLRCFVDENSLLRARHAPSAMEDAVHDTHIAVVLLCEEFFEREAPQQELRWFLKSCRNNRSTIMPVFLGITVERCMELAKPRGLEEICECVSHASERDRRTGLLVNQEETMYEILKSVRDITGPV